MLLSITTRKWFECHTHSAKDNRHGTSSSAQYSLESHNSKVIAMCTGISAYGAVMLFQSLGEIDEGLSTESPYAKLRQHCKLGNCLSQAQSSKVCNGNLMHKKELKISQGLRHADIFVPDLHHEIVLTVFLIKVNPADQRSTIKIIKKLKRNNK